MIKRNLAIQISKRQSQRQSLAQDRPQQKSYRIRQSPLLSVRQNSIKSPEFSIIQSIYHETPTCKFCKTDIGSLAKYCMCENVFYHEKCMLDNVRKRSQTIYEGAFICDFGCQQVYNIQSHYKKDVTKRGIFWLFLIISSSFFPFQSPSLYFGIKQKFISRFSAQSSQSFYYQLDLFCAIDL